MLIFPSEFGTMLSMHKRLGWCVSFLILISLFLTGVIHAARTQPNIILIMCDDMGWSDVSYYGGEISTSNLDQLDSDGLRFTQFYDCAKCTTTRASILTGLHPRRGKSSLINSNVVTVAAVSKTAGYKTGMSGNWHLGSRAPNRPIDRGFPPRSLLLHDITRL